MLRYRDKNVFIGSEICNEHKLLFPSRFKLLLKVLVSNYEKEIIEVEQTTRAEKINETGSNEESSLKGENIMNFLEGNEDVSTSDSDF